MEVKNKRSDVVSTPLYTIAFFADDNAKSRLMKLQFFDRSLLSSVHKRLEDGKFELKALKTHVISNNDYSDLLMMLVEAKRLYTAGKEFEMFMEGRKSAFGIFAIKKEGKLHAGFCIYTAQDGMVIQNSKEVVPVMNKKRVSRILEDGSFEEMIAPRFVQELNDLISKMTAVIAGTSNVLSIHLEKLNKGNNYQPKEANMELEDTSSDESVDDEYPF